MRALFSPLSSPHVCAQRMGAAFKDGEKTCGVLEKSAVLAGLGGVLSPDKLTQQNAQLQAQIETGKGHLRDIITANTETRKAIDERDKAEKVMQSKEAAAERAEKKADEKAPAIRDEAVKAGADFRLLDEQVMARLRQWTQTRGETFSRAYTVIAAVLTAPAGGGSAPSVTVTVSAPPRSVASDAGGVRSST